MSELKTKPKIAIAGATGFIGQALIPALLPDYDVIALSRFPRKSNSLSVEWREGNLFSLLDTERMLKGADFALYLVHSMLPSGRLNQGNFADFDAILADNFARTCGKYQLKQIVYLGGIVPKGVKLSPHLQSRLEVEKILKHSGIPVTFLRAGLIIGPKGSSFEMVYQLVKKLPIMLCPSWTNHPMEPAALNTVVRSILAVLDQQEAFGRGYDLGGPEQMSYKKFMAVTAEILGKKRIFLPIPFFTEKLSSHWVSWISGAPRSLVYPLVQSLRHPMLGSREKSLKIPGYAPPKIRDLLREVIQKKQELEEIPRAYEKRPQPTLNKAVRSVSRITLPRGLTAKQVAEEYLRWLPSSIPFILKVSKTTEHEIHFRILSFSVLIIKLDLSRSTEERQLFRIHGGYLSTPNPLEKEPKARLEFRQLPESQDLLVAIHDYYPKLPWILYRFTQAVIHELVMKAFGRHIQSSQASIRPKGPA